MDKKEIVITYETLFDLLKREKDRQELQKLDPHFFVEVVGYVREKRKLISVDQEATPYERTLHIQRELDNLRKIIKELYELRERKVLLMALDQSKTKSKLIDTSPLLKEERDLYDQLTKILDAFRQGLLNNVLNEKMPSVYTNLSFDNQSQEKKPAATNNTTMVRFMENVSKFVGPELEEYGPYSKDDIASLPTEIASVLVNKDSAKEIKEEN